MIRNYLATLFLLSIVTHVSSQSPQSFNYQAIVRDASGQAIPNHCTGFLIQIIKDSCNGTIVYKESFDTEITNSYGLVNLNIGLGQQLSTTSFVGIDWSNSKYFIETSMDTSCMGNYTSIACSQLLSVPFALYANEAGNSLPGPTGPQGNMGVQGAVGSTGAVGPTGPQGLAGVTGPIGLIGIQGPQGVTGSQGIVGPTGPIGLQGVTGVQGVTGPDDLDWSIDSSSNPSNIYSAVSGNVGVGLVIPHEKFHVNGNSKLSGNLLFGGSNSSDPIIADLMFGESIMWGLPHKYFKISTGGNNWGPTSASGHFEGGLGVSSSHSNYTVKSALHVNGILGSNSNPTVLKILTISATSNSNLEIGDGVALDFELPSLGSANSMLGAAIEVVKTSDDDNNTAGKMIFSTTENNEIKNQALTIDELGNIGVNSLNPSHRFSFLDNHGEIKLTEYGHILMKNKDVQDSAYWSISPRSNAKFDIGYGLLNNINGFVSTNDSKVTIDSSGRVGIGTTSPNNLLHIYSDDEVSSGGITIHKKKYARLDIKSDNYWSGIEIRRDSAGQSGRPYIDFTNNYIDNYGLRLSAPNDSILNISDGILELDEQIKIKGGSPGIGKVLTSDASGLASWNEIDMNLYEFPGIELINALIHGEETHWASITLPNGYTSVFQGFVFDNKTGHLYVSNKTGGTSGDPNETTMITKYELDGDGKPDDVSHSQTTLNVGHPQDLSIEYVDETDFRLWTSNANGDGASRITYNGSSTSYVSYSILPSGYKSSTPAVSTNGKYLVIRGKVSGDPVNRIFIYLLSDVINSSGGVGVTPFMEFDTHPNQNNSSSMKFQGIMCDNDVIYCLTGYNQTTINKLLYAYTLKGELISKKEITTGKTWATNKGSKWEPEGMALYNPHPNIKCLLIGICADDQSNGGVFGVGSSTDEDAKRIYSIGLGNGIWSIDGDFHPHDIGLYFGGGSRDITYKSTHALQFGRWDPTNLTYTESMRLSSNGDLSIGTANNNNKKFYVNGSSGGTSSWSSSDFRYKKDIVQIDNALNKLIKLKGVTYLWKDGDEKESKGFDNKRHYGVIAQDVEKEFPELVDHPGETTNFKHVEYNGFVGVFIEAIKEQQLTIDSLSKELIDLKQEFKELKRVVIVKE